MTSRRRPRSSAAGYFAALASEPPAVESAPLMSSTEPTPLVDGHEQLPLPVDEDA
jgi:hypothetical protein